ncbi:MAG TPA: redoxin domain-containing protein [Bryobacteraceae bacterium]|nr:redoxin domain-containing protein [Bryobacteraceae bacterium]
MQKMLSLVLAVFAVAAVYGQDFRLGAPVRDFTLNDLAGTQVNFSSLKGDVTVVMFIATQCPISNAYNDRMKALYNDYASRGVKFLGINPNSTEPAAEVASHAASNGFGFKVYKDPSNVVADMFGAQVTPETFVIDKAGVILYHGSIDDSQNPANIKTQGLRLALDAVLGGQAVAKAQTKAFGCTIKRAKQTS